VTHTSDISDIIVAIITPPGEGGVGALRVAGAGAVILCSEFLCWNSGKNKKAQANTPEPFFLQYGAFTVPENKSEKKQTLDEVMAVWMPEGKSYTGDEQVEIFAHGGRQTLQHILRALYAAGARPAEPGEFTQRAFLSGKIDLTKAEAVAEIISAKSEFAYRAARDDLFGKTSDTIVALREKMILLAAELTANVDFPEEEIDPDEYQTLLDLASEIDQQLGGLIQSYSGGAIVRDGFRVALGGRPNAGKSSLFNALLKSHRALVSETPGTTRDYLSEWITLGDFAVELIDTAGLREGAGKIEAAGQDFARKLLAESNLTIWLVDISSEHCFAELADDLKRLKLEHFVLIANKTDLHDGDQLTKALATLQELVPRDAIFPVSCKTGAGLAEFEIGLQKRIDETVSDQTDGLVVTSERQMKKFSDARAALQLASNGMTGGASPELIAFDVRTALRSLDEITGAVYTDDLLGVIFSKFCIGK